MSDSNPDPETRKILHGIQLVLEELRDLKREFAEDRKRAEEDRKRAEEDRKRAEEDRSRADARLESYLRRSDERFDQVVAESAKRERGLSRALAVIGKVGRDIHETQRVHTELLRDILRTLRLRGNGKGGNGR